MHDLEVPNEDGVSILFYLQKIFPGLLFSTLLGLFCVVFCVNIYTYVVTDLVYLKHPDEWENFLQRVGCTSEEELKKSDDLEELRLWASFRGQTLTRTGTLY